MSTKPVIGLLHPGAMGHSVGAAMVRTGHKVLWASEGRSEASRKRAADVGLEDAGTITELVRRAGIIVSVCPPDAAVELAANVAGHGFSGIYLDANAIAPETAHRIAGIIARAGGSPVDGGIVGLPPSKPGTTRLYLSGGAAGSIEPLFAGSYFEAINIGPEMGAASALKVCFAAYTKGTSALLLTILAAAAAEGVEDALMKEFAISQPQIAGHQLTTARRSLGKAWRFVGEMEEIADSFAARGVPDGFHRSAADLFRRLACFKDDDNAPLEAALAEIARATPKAAE